MDGNWYRGLFLRVYAGSRVQVQFVDVGNHENVVISRITSLHYLTYNCQHVAYKSPCNITRNRFPSLDNVAENDNEFVRQNLQVVLSCLLTLLRTFAMKGTKCNDQYMTSADAVQIILLLLWVSRVRRLNPIKTGLLYRVIHCVIRLIREEE